MASGETYYRTHHTVLLFFTQMLVENVVGCLCLLLHSPGLSLVHAYRPILPDVASVPDFEILNEPKAVKGPFKIMIIICPTLDMACKYRPSDGITYVKISRIDMPLWT